MNIKHNLIFRISLQESTYPIGLKLLLSPYTRQCLTAIDNWSSSHDLTFACDLNIATYHGYAFICFMIGVTLQYWRKQNKTSMGKCDIENSIKIWKRSTQVLFKENWKIEQLHILKANIT